MASERHDDPKPTDKSKAAPVPTSGPPRGTPPAPTSVIPPAHTKKGDVPHKRLEDGPNEDQTEVQMDKPGVDPSTGSPTSAHPGEAVEGVHAVPPGQMPATQEEKAEKAKDKHKS